VVTGDWKINILIDWNEIFKKSFQGQWLQYAENAFDSHIFFHPSLGMAWLDTYRPMRKLKPLFCIAENDSSVIFMPLVLWTQNWKNAYRKVIVPVGYSDFDYHDPLVNQQLQPDDWASFYKSLTGALKSKVRFDAIEITGIRSEINDKNWSKENDVALFSDLGPFINTESFLQSLTTSLRGDIRRQIRRISEPGPLILFHYNTVNEALDTLPHFLKLHSERWPRAYKAPEFHKNILLNGIESGLVDFTSLKCGGKILGYHLGFIYKNRYYYYMPATDPEFENLSPGKVHLYKLVEYAIEKKCQIFDHLRGDESYKSGWTDKFQPLFRFSCKNSGAGSGIRNLLYSLKQKIT
jgi:CelD/BcsL family acetyltransferase involved in cellulose biosynthesis